MNILFLIIVWIYLSLSFLIFVFRRKKEKEYFSKIHNNHSKDKNVTIKKATSYSLFFIWLFGIIIVGTLSNNINMEQKSDYLWNIFNTNFDKQYKELKKWSVTTDDVLKNYILENYNSVSPELVINKIKELKSNGGKSIILENKEFTNVIESDMFTDKEKIWILVWIIYAEKYSQQLKTQ